MDGCAHRDSFLGGGMLAPLRWASSAAPHLTAVLIAVQFLRMLTALRVGVARGEQGSNIYLQNDSEATATLAGCLSCARASSL